MVSKKEAEDYTSSIQFAKVEYFEVSAKTGEGVEGMFDKAAYLLFNKITGGNVDKDLIEVML